MNNRKMNGILVRHAKDDFYALLVAQAMENKGAEVFSVTVDISRTEGRYTIWAKIGKDSQIEAIDKEIERGLEDPRSVLG